MDFEMTVSTLATMICSLILTGLEDNVFDEMTFDDFVDGLAHILSILGPPEYSTDGTVYLSMN